VVSLERCASFVVAYLVLLSHRRRWLKSWVDEKVSERGRAEVLCGRWGAPRSDLELVRSLELAIVQQITCHVPASGRKRPSGPRPKLEYDLCRSR
jgi:hypothetical protein